MEKEEKNIEYYKNLINGRGKLIEPILQNIEINSEYIKGIDDKKESYNIAICGSYGSGKTFFINSFKDYINTKLPLDKKKPIIFHINAWEDNFLDNPILSIGLRLKECIKNNPTKKDENIVQKYTNNICNIASIAWKMAPSIILKKTINFITNKTGIEDVVDGINEIYKCYKESTTGIDESEICLDFDNYNQYLNNIQELLTSYLENLGNKIYIIIDELDRCKPDYSVKFLEAINHIFSIYGLVFIFTIDRYQLASAMKIIYGQDLNFDAYFKKFIHYEFDLNQIYGTENDNKHYVSILADKYFKNEKKYDFDCLIHLSDNLKLTPRDIEYAFRILYFLDRKNVINTHTKFYYFYNIMFLIGLKSCNNNLYYKLFKTKTNEIIDLDINVLKEVFEKYDFKEYKSYNNILLIKGILFDRDSRILKWSFSDKLISLNKIFTSFSNYFKDEDKVEIKEILEPQNKIGASLISNNESENKYNEYVNDSMNYSERLETSILRYCFELIK